MKITIYRPGQEAEVREEPIAGVLVYETLRALIQPLLDGAEIERVNVLHEGAYTDMFVDEMGGIRLPSLSRNEPATVIYRANILSQHPTLDPETLPAIYGPAVLFERSVWR